MKKFKQLKKIKEVYDKGGNIIQFLHEIDNTKNNSIEDVLISYDFQSGSYIAEYYKNREFNDDYCRSIAELMEGLGSFESIIEIGVGEATTLNTLIKNLKKKPTKIMGLDISWSRLKFAKEFLKENNHDNVSLFAANLFEIPLLDNSIDIVYTSHSLEPNGGKEKEGLEELYRITNKYLILLEPSFEFANEEAKKRMKNHGYVTKLYETAKKLGYDIKEHRLFDYTQNPLNPTGLIVIEKMSKTSNNSNYVCPISQLELTKYNDSFLFSKESFLTYPVLKEIPCLLKENSILASHLLTDYQGRIQEFKKHNII